MLWMLSPCALLCSSLAVYTPSSHHIVLYLTAGLGLGALCDTT